MLSFLLFLLWVRWFGLFVLFSGWTYISFYENFICQYYICLIFTPTFSHSNSPISPTPSQIHDLFKVVIVLHSHTQNMISLFSVSPSMYIFLKFLNIHFSFNCVKNFLVIMMRCIEL